MWFQGKPFPSSSPFPFHHTVFLFQLLLRDYCLFPLLNHMLGRPTSNSRAPAGSALHVLLLILCSVPNPQPWACCEVKDTAYRNSQTRDTPFPIWCVVICPIDIKSNSLPLSSNTIIDILNEGTGIINISSKAQNNNVKFHPNT